MLEGIAFDLLWKVKVFVSLSIDELAPRSCREKPARCSSVCPEYMSSFLLPLLIRLLLPLPDTRPIPCMNVLSLSLIFLAFARLWSWSDAVFLFWALKA